MAIELSHGWFVTHKNSPWMDLCLHSLAIDHFVLILEASNKAYAISEHNESSESTI